MIKGIWSSLHIHSQTSQATRVPRDSERDSEGKEAAGVSEKCESGWDSQRYNKH